MKGLTVACVLAIAIGAVNCAPTFSTVDANSDGKATWTELDAYTNDYTHVQYALHDLNRDVVLFSNEYDNMTSMLDNFDAMVGQDELATYGELDTQLPSKYTPSEFRKHDLNRDKVLTLTEFIMMEYFNLADTSTTDNLVSYTEFTQIFSTITQTLYNQFDMDATTGLSRTEFSILVAFIAADSIVPHDEMVTWSELEDFQEPDPSPSRKYEREQFNFADWGRNGKLDGEEFEEMVNLDIKFSDLDSNSNNLVSWAEADGTISKTVFDKHDLSDSRELTRREYIVLKTFTKLRNGDYFVSYTELKGQYSSPGESVFNDFKDEAIGLDREEFTALLYFFEADVDANDEVSLSEFNQVRNITKGKFESFDTDQTVGLSSTEYDHLNVSIGFSTLNDNSDNVVKWTEFKAGVLDYYDGDTNGKLNSTEYADLMDSPL